MKFFFLSSFLLTVQLLLAQPGTPDLYFADQGTCTIFTGQLVGATASAVAIQPDGKLLAGGQLYDQSNDNDFILARLLPNGDLDVSFGDHGLVQTNLFADEDWLFDLAVQPDGKILGCGRSRDLVSGALCFALVRYNSDGSLDESFGQQGIVKTTGGATASANAMVLQPDGKIVLAGIGQLGNTQTLMVTRYNANGSLDHTFSGDGKMLYGVNSYGGGVNAMALQQDGSIVLTGRVSINPANLEYGYFVSRLLPNGQIDPFFGTDGAVIDRFTSSTYTSSGGALVLQQDGKILVAGSGVDHWAMARYHPDGTLDDSFGTGGKLVTTFPDKKAGIQSMALQPDGKIVAVGNGGLFTAPYNPITVLARYDSTGTLDPTFGTDGSYTYLATGATSNFIHDMVLQTDGKAVLAGHSGEIPVRSMIFARFLTDLNVGLLDFSDTRPVAMVYPNPITEKATLQYTLARADKVSIQLRDLQGHLLNTYLDQAPQEAGAYNQPIVLAAALPAGAYSLVLTTGQGQMSVRIIK